MCLLKQQTCISKDTDKKKRFKTQSKKKERKIMTEFGVM